MNLIPVNTLSNGAGARMVPCIKRVNLISNLNAQNRYETRQKPEAYQYDDYQADVLAGGHWLPTPVQ